MLTACGKQTTKRLEVQVPLNAVVSATVNGIDYSAKLEAFPDGKANFTVNIPEDINGLKLNFSSDGCQVIYGDVKTEYSKSAISPCFEGLFSVLSEIRTTEADSIVQSGETVEVKYGKNSAVYDTQNEKFIQINANGILWNFE